MDDRRRGSLGLPIAVAITLLALAAAAAGVVLTQDLTGSGDASRTRPANPSAASATVRPWPTWPVSGLPTAPSYPTPRLAPTPSPTPALVALPKLSPNVRYAKESYYPVTGSSPHELILSMYKGAPADSEKAGAETLAFAALLWSFSSTTSYASGTCRIRSASVDASYKVTLPRWTKPGRVRPELLAWWKVVLEKLRSHEERHVQIYRKWVTEFRRHVVGMRCSAADAYFDRISRKMEAEGEAFDAEHGSIDWPPYSSDWDG